MFLLFSFSYLFSFFRPIRRGQKREKGSTRDSRCPTSKNKRRSNSVVTQGDRTSTRTSFTSQSWGGNGSSNYHVWPRLSRRMTRGTRSRRSGCISGTIVSDGEASGTRSGSTKGGSDIKRFKGINGCTTSSRASRRRRRLSGSRPHGRNMDRKDMLNRGLQTQLRALSSRTTRRRNNR